MGVTLRAVRKVYGDGTVGLEAMDLDVMPGEFLTLLGPSGCGKTTTLRLIAGLEEVTSGIISIGGKDVTRADPGDRDVAMVFQSYALYPHMTALDNMTLGLMTRGMARLQAETRAREVAAMLGIETLLAKKPAQLSGGQRQRIALGRAIVRRPACFLMDEPLSNVDLKLREKMRTELKKLHRGLGVTTIYVTHDQSEALVLSDRIAVLRDGKLLQLASPADIYANPVSDFVAEFVGSPSINLIAGERTAAGVSVAGRHMAGLEWAAGSGAVWVGARAEDVVEADPGATVFKGRIELAEPAGGRTLYHASLDCGRGLLKGSDLLVLERGAHEGFAIGDCPEFSFRPDRLRVFDRSTGLALKKPSEKTAPPCDARGAGTNAIGERA